MQAKVNSLYDLVDIPATAKYDGKEIEESYEDPNIEPKNKAHENVKYWYKFKNTIYFDDVLYDITFNIRDKGKKQYQYLIEFFEKNRKATHNSNTAKKSLLRTNELPSNKRIPQNDPSVNSNSMQKSEKDAQNISGDNKDVRFNLTESNNSPEKLNSGILNRKVVSEYSKNVDVVLNGTYNSSNSIVMCGATKIMTDIGLNKIPVTISKEHIYSVAKSEAEAKKEGKFHKNTNYHGLGGAVVKDIPNKLENPIAIVAHPDFVRRRNRDSAHKVMVLVDFVHNGRSVIAPIEVDAEQNVRNLKMDVNHVATYFDKKNISDILKEALALESQGKTGFYFADIKRVAALLKGQGYQLPKSLRTHNSNIIIRKINTNVNRKIDTALKSHQFLKWFGDWRANDTTEVNFVDVNTNVIETADIPRGAFVNIDTNWNIESTSTGIEETSHKKGKWPNEYHALKNIDNMISYAVLLDTIVVSEPSKKMGRNTVFVHHLYCPINIVGTNQKGIAKLYITENPNSKRFYLSKIEKVSSDARGYSAEYGISPRGVKPTPNDTNISVAEIYAFVKEHDVDYEKDSKNPVHFKPNQPSKIVNNDGTPKVLYHQTENELTIFDTRHKGAGTRDNETPFGIFMKSLPENVGLNGDIQMPLYANIKNPLEASDRQDLVNKLRNISAEFGRLYDEHKNLDAEYRKRFDEATKQFEDYIVEWRKANPEASRTAIFDDEKFNELYEAEDVITEEWGNAAEQLELKTKEVITAVLRQNGYDGVYLKNDVGSFGRQTDAYIALDNTQVKSATDNIGTFDRSNPDIRFNLTSSGDYSTRKIVEAKALASDDSEFKLSVSIDSKREYDFGVLQGDIDSYVDNAYKK